MEFPVSGVEVSLIVPPLVAFAVSCLSALGGLSGAFLLLPFQMSVLGFTSPAVTATNLIFNVVAAPGGVYGYARQGRVAWPLAWIVLAGTLPGVFLGAWVRTRFLAEPRRIEVFVGLIGLGLNLLLGRVRAIGPPPASARVRTLAVSLRAVEFDFAGKIYRFRPFPVALLAIGVGLVGGIYGVGGAAIIAPFAVAVLGLPVYIVAGASLLGTFATSAAGVAFFHLLGTRPDWLLGGLFGLGGLAGTYAGARLQRHVPERLIRAILGLLVAALGLAYVF